MALPWTKFQDFYLRLGFLKVLVATLSPERRSATNDLLCRKLGSPLLEPARNHSSLWPKARDLVPWDKWYEKDYAKKKFDKPSVAEALLVIDQCPSWLSAVTAPTAYKVLDWGHDLLFVGRGNQITERGLLLRALIPRLESEAFLAGDPTAWNPFVLTDSERIFFLYHLSEIDQVTRDLISSLADVDQDAVLEASDVGKLTCRALFGVLNRIQPRLLPRDLPSYRVARELATVIATELHMDDVLAEYGASKVHRAPRPIRISPHSTGSSGSKREHTTKNSDHQAIPRFEQLADLGFVSKEALRTGEALGSSEADKKRWKYRTTDLCRRWRDALGQLADSASRWEWHGQLSSHASAAIWRECTCQFAQR